MEVLVDLLRLFLYVLDIRRKSSLIPNKNCENVGFKIGQSRVHALPECVTGTKY